MSRHELALPGRRQRQPRCIEGLTGSQGCRTAGDSHRSAAVNGSRFQPDHPAALPALATSEGLSPYTRHVRSHEWIDRRSLALHEAVAAKLEADPELLGIARTNLARWLERERAGALLEWAALLDQRPLREIVALLRSPDERSTRLRQSSPFAGVLTREERLRILRQHDPRSA
jgi:hypothetical protein